VTTPRQRVKGMLARRELVLGISPAYPAPALAEFLAKRGFDMIFIDCEYVGPDIAGVGDMTRAAHAAGAAAVLRPWSKDPGLIRRYLNCGIDGLIAPEIETVAEIEAIRAVVAHTSPPDAENIILLPLIESAKGAENVDAILRHEGVDGIQIGTGDLAVSLGLPRRGENPKVREIAFEILQLSRKLGKSAGAPVNAYGIAPVVEAGGNCIMFFLNDLLGQAVDATLAAFPQRAKA
jgi:4-hydroxy-2-oxoheptanedioate aldolase